LGPAPPRAPPPQAPPQAPTSLGHRPPGPRLLQAPPRSALVLTCRSSLGGCPHPVGRQYWSSSEPCNT
jgi:hypothetical protein